MKLTLDDFNLISQGAVRIEEDDGKFLFYRFTEEQMEVYKERDKNFDTPFWYEIAAMPAGIKFSFITNSSTLLIKINVNKIVQHYFFSLDVLQNGVYIGSINNFGNTELTECNINTPLPQGEFSKEFTLAEGKKQIDVYLPYSVKFELLEMSIDDGATLTPINKPQKKMITYGDSITHGFHSALSFQRYATKLANALEMEEICKSVAGETFRPQLAALKDSFFPDCVLVAYGTNDWECFDSFDDFYNACEGFFSSLCDIYPNAKIFVITPIWRADWDRESKIGTFDTVETTIKSVVSKYKNIKLINGWNLVPHDKKYFGDGFLHPSTEGHDYYFRNLLEAIQNCI